jgi:subtilisin
MNSKLAPDEAWNHVDPGEYVVVGKLFEHSAKNALENCKCALDVQCKTFSQIGADQDFCAIPSGTGIVLERLGMVLCGTSIQQAAASKLFSKLAVIRAGNRLRPIPEIAVKAETSTALCEDRWGLKEIGALDTDFTGRNVRVCVIDTGIDISHKDLLKVNKAHRRSFVGDSTAMDFDGHGTRCAGIVAGKDPPRIGLRYSVAPDAELFVAKVFDRDGGFCEVRLIAALEWAVQNGCAVVSMSIGDDVLTTTSSSEAIEIAASAALMARTLIIAGSGNDSDRPRTTEPVDNPANCTSIMAVGAVDGSMKIAQYSNAPVQIGQPKVDIVAPGESCSATKGNSYAAGRGTSIATPFVAGVAALYAEACPLVRGKDLWNLLLKKVRPLTDQDPRDVGAGLVHAPRKTDSHLCELIPPN